MRAARISELREYAADMDRIAATCDGLAARHYLLGNTGDDDDRFSYDDAAIYAELAIVNRANARDARATELDLLAAGAIV